MRIDNFEKTLGPRDYQLPLNTRSGERSCALIHRINGIGVKHLIFLSFYILISIVLNLNLSAAPLNSNDFPSSSLVSKQVKFWERIFYHYPTHSVVIHDQIRPEHLIDVIDFKLWSKKNGFAGIPNNSLRDKITQSYLKRYRIALKRFRRFGKSAMRFGAIEQRIFSVYKRSSEGLNNLYRGKITIRSQRGLANEFIDAASRAQKYLPFMEKTFRNQNVPVAITRLAFVESMFNLSARSRVGASGVWQFMPATARKFMTINSMVDERNSPYKSTVAAAQLLMENFRALKSWPLAITAYNHGQAGMRRAVKQVGSKDMDKIILRYHSPSFKFASKNFYAEFRAAANTYQRLLRENKVKKIYRRQNVIPVLLESPLSTYQLLRLSPVKKSALLEFNRCLNANAFKRYRHRKLPKSFELYLPEKKAVQLKLKLTARTKKKYAKTK